MTGLFTRILEAAPRHAITSLDAAIPVGDAAF